MTAVDARRRDAPATGADGFPSVVAQAVTRTPIAVVTVTLAVAVAAPGVLDRAGPWLLAAAIVIGLPHGAADHLLPVWSGLVMRPRRWVVLLIAYAGAALLALGATLTQPSIALALLALAAVHFGCGEVAVGALRRGRAPSRTRAAAVAVGVGIMIVAGPLALHPSATDPLLAGIHPDLPTFMPAGLRASLLALGVAAGACGALLAAREADRVSAVEIVLLLSLPIVVPPLAAFAAFFGGWHAPRHTLRLLAEDPRNDVDLAAGAIGRPLRRFLAAAAPTTAIAAVGVAGLGAVAAHGRSSLAIAVLLALTVPHALAVGWLDLRVARGLR